MQPTILDFIGGKWLPFECSVCGRQRPGDIQFAWRGEPIYCQQCAERAPQDVRQRLQRVRVARQALGFDGWSSRYDVEEALWPAQGRFFPKHRLMPAVFGHPFTNPVLRTGQIAELYYLHGLSGCSPDQLHRLPASDKIAPASLSYAVDRVRPQVAETYLRWKRYQESLWWGKDSEGDGEKETPPLRSEVLVYIGGAIIPEAYPEDHYMWSWQPEAPWLGYKEGPHQTDSLSKQETDSLFKVGRQLLGKYSRRRPEGTGNFAPDEGNRFMDSLTKVLEQHERDGVRITSVQMLADTWGVLGRSQLYEMFKQFPEARERYRQHRQKPNAARNPEP